MGDTVRSETGHKREDKKERKPKQERETSSACRYMLEEEKITKLSLKYHCNLSRDLNAYIKMTMFIKIINQIY